MTQLSRRILAVGVLLIASGLAATSCHQDSRSSAGPLVEDPEGAWRLHLPLGVALATHAKPVVSDPEKHAVQFGLTRHAAESNGPALIYVSISPLSKISPDIDLPSALTTPVVHGLPTWTPLIRETSVEGVRFVLLEHIPANDEIARYASDSSGYRFEFEVNESNVTDTMPIAAELISSFASP
jgi:hypothetical protein